MKLISTGIDQIKSSPLRALGIKKNARIAALCHPASVTQDFIHLETILEKTGQLKALFGPQHGIHGETQDNMIEWQDTTDAHGRPVYSLYGERRKPSLESLESIDAVVVDLFDVGARYYTFIYTLSYMLEACAEARIPVYILDRPNPLGDIIEGPLLDLDFRSFVGLHRIPVCHGMTIAELASLFSKTFSATPDIHVIKVRGWKRSLFYNQTNLPWTLPSPNMPSFQTALLYPGMCLLEGTSLSEGRGTTRPFELIGAPFFEINEIQKKYQEECKKLRLSPVVFHRQGFIPTFHKFSGQVCHGFIQHVKNPTKFKPLRHAVLLLWVLRRLYGNQWQWKQPPYEYEYEKLPIDILAGGEKVRHTIDDGLSLQSLFREFEADEKSFRKSRRSFLIYK